MADGGIFVKMRSYYYPFGLTMSGISSSAANGTGYPINKKKYNGYEENKDFDLNLYESFYRTHDPQIGRFLQIDPKPNDLESPYVAMGNNPILNFDILGDTTGPGEKGYWQGARDGFTGFFSAVGEKIKDNFNNPGQALKDGLNPNILLSLSPIVQAIDNFKTTTSFVDNLSNGNNYEAGKIAGGKSGEGVLQGGVMLVTAGVVKVAGTGSATLFRAVSSAELTDAAANGVRNTATGYQTGKLFATTASDAAQYGKSNFGLDGIPNTIMKVKVPNSVMKTAYVGEMDGMKAVSIPTNQLPQVKVLGPLNYSPKPTNPYKFPGAW